MCVGREGGNKSDGHGIEIIQKFADHGKLGLAVEGRSAFNQMMDQGVMRKQNFD